jgi:UDP-GlcNAc:undecaprenyl-phosphate GlcNAc-1-phosphate transferase
MTKYLISFLLAAGFSLILTPLIRSFARWAKVLDLPSDRKIHKKPIPLLGGIPIFLAFNLTLLLVLVFDKTLVNESILSNWKGLLVCQLIILTLGIYDDIKRLSPWTKLAFQGIAGIVIVLFGFGIEALANPLTGSIIHIGFLSLPVTVFWLVLITNALNLVDGLDGLAAGTSIIAAATIFGLSYLNQNIGVGIVSIALAGSVLGFFRYNFHPAKIFLGDSGSLLLGFILAVFSIQGSSKGAVLVAVMAPVLALGLPIMETLLSVIRRLFGSLHLVDYSTKKGSFKSICYQSAPLFQADKNHIHHRLIQQGYSQRKAVSILYGICISLSLLAFLSVAVKNINWIPFLGAVVIAVFIGVTSLKYQEFKILENGLLIPVFNFPVVNTRLFHTFFDLAMMSFSSYLCLLLIFRGFSGEAKLLFIRSLPLLLLIKIVVFFLLGIYRKSWTYPSLEEMTGLFAAVLLSSLLFLLLMEIFFGVGSFGGLAYFVLDFYIFLTLSGGFRFSYRVLISYYKRGFSRRGKKILIYGAGYKGSTALKEIRNNGEYPVNPVGYLDDDPAKRGRSVHGCPVLGSLDELESILGENEIAEIVISTGKIARDRVRRLIEICRQRGIAVRQFEFRFYEFS